MEEAVAPDNASLCFGSNRLNEVVVYDAEAVPIWNDVIAKCRDIPNAIFHKWVSDVVPVLSIPWPPVRGALTDQQKVRTAYLLLWVIYGPLCLCGQP